MTLKNHLGWRSFSICFDSFGSKSEQKIVFGWHSILESSRLVCKQPFRFSRSGIRRWPSQSVENAAFAFRCGNNSRCKIRLDSKLDALKRRWRKATQSQLTFSDESWNFSFFPFRAKKQLKRFFFFLHLTHKAIKSPISVLSVVTFCFVSFRPKRKRRSK